MIFNLAVSACCTKSLRLTTSGSFNVPNSDCSRQAIRRSPINLLGLGGWRMSLELDDGSPFEAAVDLSLAFAGAKIAEMAH